MCNVRTNGSKTALYMIPLILLIAIFAQSVIANQIAFPGAEGYGKYAQGGRAQEGVGGEIFYVDTTSDAPYEASIVNNVGTFRESIEKRHYRITTKRGWEKVTKAIWKSQYPDKLATIIPRTVIFRVSGTITLKVPDAESDPDWYFYLTIKDPYLTIAGESAPNQGITIRHSGESRKALLTIATHDVIIRHIRIRPGPFIGGRHNAIAHARHGYYVAVGNRGKIYGSDNVAMHNGAEDSGSLQNHIYDIAYDSLSNSFIAVGQKKTYASTWSGTSMTWEDSSTDYDLNGVLITQNAYYAVGNDGVIVTKISPEADWTIIDSSSDKKLNNIIYGNENYVVVGNDGTILTTNNPADWKPVVSVSTTNNLNDVIHFKDNNDQHVFIAVGDHGTILKSTDPANIWTPVTIDNFHNLYGVSFGAEILVAVGDEGTVLTSEDFGESWFPATTNVEDSLRGVRFGNNMFVAVGDFATILTAKPADIRSGNLLTSEVNPNLSYNPSVSWEETNIALAVRNISKYEWTPEKGYPQESPHNIVIDHCSFSWNGDDLVFVENESKNITIQRSLFGEAIKRGNNSGTQQPWGGAGLTLAGVSDVSVLKNAFVSINKRLPNTQGYTTCASHEYMAETPTARFDVVNNVIYNWKDSAGQLVGSVMVHGDDTLDKRFAMANYIGNTYKAGPNSEFILDNPENGKRILFFKYHQYSKPENKCFSTLLSDQSTDDYFLVVDGSTDTAVNPPEYNRNDNFDLKLFAQANEFRYVKYGFEEMMDLSSDLIGIKEPDNQFPIARDKYYAAFPVRDDSGDSRLPGIIYTATSTYQELVESKHVGAKAPYLLDSVDEGLLEDITNNSGVILHDYSEISGWENGPSYPDLNLKGASTPYPDVDFDGIDDNWERSQFDEIIVINDTSLNPETGYTYLEEFLHALAGDNILVHSDADTAGTDNWRTSGTVHVTSDAVFGEVFCLCEKGAMMMQDVHIPGNADSGSQYVTKVVLSGMVRSEKNEEVEDAGYPYLYAYQLDKFGKIKKYMKTAIEKSTDWVTVSEEFDLVEGVVKIRFFLKRSSKKDINESKKAYFDRLSVNLY